MIGRVLIEFRTVSTASDCLMPKCLRRSTGVLEFFGAKQR
jgi:hypothetical protein